MPMQRLPFAFYNLAPAGDPNRGAAQVARELNALANNHQPDRRRRRPKVIGWCEGIHRGLPDLEHYRLIRSTKNLSRANIGLYVLKHLDVGNIEWHQHEETWDRVKHPGTHEARATLTVEVEDVLVGVGHAPQNDGHNTAAARREWVDIVDGIFSAAPRSILLSDPNGLNDDLRRRLPPTTVAFGTPVEAVILRGYTLEDARTPEVVNRVRMLSDHRRALLGRAVRR